jgi:hypothetical protein
MGELGGERQATPSEEERTMVTKQSCEIARKPGLAR